MAAVPVTIEGILTLDTGAEQNVTLAGNLSLTGLSIGGGPIIPPPEASKPPSGPGLEAKIFWTEADGWQVVFIPTGEHPAPSN